MPEKTIRLGVDIGGTFTDVVLENGAARYSTGVGAEKGRAPSPWVGLVRFLG